MTISKSARFLGVALFLAVTSQATLQAQFTIHPNGVTVLCAGAADGATGTVGGVTYTKRTKNQITTDNAATTCTSGITDMSQFFNGATTFNEDISSWDVSSVTSMNRMFLNATAFNQDIGNWDVGNVANMANMFNVAIAFNQDIGRWDTGSVTNMSWMFQGIGSSFNQDIGDWNTSAVQTMERMFQGATHFDQDIGRWITSSVDNMFAMFMNAFRFTQDIGLWDTSSVITMERMFEGAREFNRDIGSWDVSSVTTMASMFKGTAASNGSIFNQDIGSWDVSAVTNMSFMFFNATAFNQDLSGWCVSRIASTPTDFSTGSALIPTNTPVWGTCPVVQRVISGDAGWRLISFPITGGKISDIADDTPIQGIAGGANPGAAPNVYLYDDSGAFTAPADVSNPFGDGKGFAVYFFNNADAGSAVLPVRLDAAGAQPDGDVTVTLNPTAFGATLVGNPYASNFQADATNLFFAGDGDFQNNITFWNDGANNGAGSYSVQDRTAPYIIRPWQGFWVERGATGGASTLTFKAGGKTTSNATGAFFSKGLAQAANRADLRFTLTSERSYDEAIRLSLREDATTGYDADDAGKLLPLLPAYAIMGFRSNDMLKSVESLPWGLTESVTIPMEQTLVGVDGGFALAWSGMESFPAGWDLTLHDSQTGVDTDMRADSSYTFDATAPAAKVSPLTLLDQLAPTLQKPAAAGTRFALTVNPNTGVVSTETNNTPLAFSLDQNYPNPFNPSTTIPFELNTNAHVTLRVYDVHGRLVADLVNKLMSAGKHDVVFNGAQLSSGVYLYELFAGEKRLVRAMILVK